MQRSHPLSPPCLEHEHTFTSTCIHTHTFAGLGCTKWQFWKLWSLTASFLWMLLLVLVNEIHGTGEFVIRWCVCTNRCVSERQRYFFIVCTHMASYSTFTSEFAYQLRSSANAFAKLGKQKLSSLDSFDSYFKWILWKTPHLPKFKFIVKTVVLSALSLWKSGKNPLCSRFYLSTVVRITYEGIGNTMGTPI